ncbi:MAG: gliding motility-associated C-terminal domain-containing protein [Chitinophagaceae bacterium]
MKRATSILLVVITLLLANRSQGQCTIPDSLFSSDTIVVCNDTTTQLTAIDIKNVNYSWASNPAVTVNAITVTRNGKYVLTVSDAYCSKTDTVTVLFNSFVLSPQVEDLKLCKGAAPETLKATGQNILWYTGPVGGTGSITPPVQNTADTGHWEYWVSQTIRGCETPRAEVKTNVIDKPMFELGDAFIIPCDAQGVVLQVIPEEGTSYTWSNGGGSGKSMIVTGRGKYSLYAENMCGNYRDTVQAVECKDRCVQFPSGFTPNGDGKNDVFRAAAFCPVPKYHVIVFNRNGEKVFETSDPNEGWNGVYRGKKAPVGVYVYYSEYFDFVLKRSLTDKGTVVLLD